jgi:EAL domain-containing protein (putative c-di-GMP-specific phosphodiesterase class I)
MVPVMLGLTVFTAAAMAIAVYMVVNAGLGMAPVAGAILLLSLSVLAMAVVALVKLSRHDRSLAAQKDQLRKLSGRSEEVLARLDSLEQRTREPDPRLDRVVADVGALRRDIHDLLHPRKIPAASAPHVPAQPMLAAAAKTAQPRQKNAETLSLQLEPVIDLAAGSTCHYRALLSLSGGEASNVPYEQLIQKADQGGMRPALDVRLVRLVAPVLRRLRAKNPALRVFVPIARTTLGAREEAGRLLAILQRDADVASGIVFEFTQSDLGRLEGPGIETLARLARSGAVLGLSEVSAEGLDIGALRQLGVRYLTFQPAAADGGQLTPAAWADFVRHAQALQVQLVAGSIKTPQQASAANKFARFGFGPFFAPPRRVRADAGMAAPAGPAANSANVA